MNLVELLKKVPDLATYIQYMPNEIKEKLYIKTLPAGVIIHQKDCILDYFGIVCVGQHRVINEFENGNIFMIEKNDAIDFIGEVTILAGEEKTSVTIETTTPCTILFLPRKEFELWIQKDIHILKLVSQKVAQKLYRSSYRGGVRIFYSPQYLLLDYLIKYVKENKINIKEKVIVKKTREELYEELAMNVKTINRTIKKLKEIDLIEVYKGKIAMSPQQFEKAQEEIEKFL